MKAAFITETGESAKIQYGELPTPEIKDNEVLIKISAVAVNPLDTYIRAGKYDLFKPLPSPYIIGSDAIGFVEKVGGNVKTYKIGDRVWTNSLGINGRQGSFAEYAAVDEQLLYPAPDNVEDDQVVAAAHSGATACIGLIRFALLKANEVIFVNGGAGSVGSAIIQLAVARGARVITATSGDDKKKWCEGLGAELVLDYKQDDYAETIRLLAPEGIDVFWDTSRHPDLEQSVALLALRGRIILMAGYESHPTLPVGPFYTKECSIRGFALKNATVMELHGSAEITNRCLQEGRLRSKIAEVLPLSEAAKAHSLVESEKGLWGKVILKP